jgi:predicted acylesterase/phospholipase RssA
MSRAPTIGLIMTGGGARAAYQVGVLRALSELLPRNVRSPFPIICGTSAGAINAAVLAADAGDFRRAVRRLMTVWKNFHVHHVYRADPLGAAHNSLRWTFTVLTGGAFARSPVSLLDNSPLVELVGRHLDFSSIAAGIERDSRSLFSREARVSSPGSVRAASGLPRPSRWSMSSHQARCRSFFPPCTSTANISATVRCGRLRR